MAMSKAERKRQEQAKKAAALRATLADVRSPQRVVGLDLSYTSPGFAAVDADGTSHTEHVKLAKLDLGDRLVRAAELAMRYAVHGHADLVIVETPFSSPVRAGSGGDNGDSVREVHGAVKVTFAAARQAGHRVPPVVGVAPAQVKSFAQPADSSKPAMVARARELFDLRSSNNDEADALVLAHLGWALLGHPRVVLPGAHMATIHRMLLGRELRAAEKRELLAS